MKVICPGCGFEDEGNFCSNCARPLREAAPASEEKGVIPAEGEGKGKGKEKVPGKGTKEGDEKAEKNGGNGIDLPAERGAGALQIPPGSSWLDKCPACRSGSLSPAAKKRLFGLVRSESFLCASCDAEFSKSGDGYSLLKVPEASNPALLEYANIPLSEEDWIRIAYGGMPKAREREWDLSTWLGRLREGEVEIRTEADSPVLMKKNEELVLSFPNVSLFEPRKVTRGGTAGTSIRVAKGVRVRVGGFQAESHEELRKIDGGTLTLTDKRIVFSGAKRTASFPLDKIVSMEPYRDAVSIRREGKEKVQNFVGIDQGTVTFSVDGREYKEPFSGVIFMYIIEGLMK